MQNIGTQAHWISNQFATGQPDGMIEVQNPATEEVRAGTVWINDPLTDNYAGPFGGMKMSGTARELGEEGLDSFRETKHVHWDMSSEGKDWWYPYGR